MTRPRTRHSSKDEAEATGIMRYAIRQCGRLEGEVHLNDGEGSSQPTMIPKRAKRLRAGFQPVETTGLLSSYLSRPNVTRERLKKDAS